MQRMEMEGHLPEPEILEIGIQIAEALLYAHEEHSIIHRDIKPHNIMLAAKGQAKLADLGLAKCTMEDSSITQTGAAMGTPYYMSPEQAEDAKQAGHRSDIYSLGITMLHGATGKPPYDGDTAISVMLAHINKPLPTGAELGVPLSTGFDALMQKMSAKEPGERYQDYESLLADMRELQSSQEVGFAPTIVRQAPLILRPKRPRPQARHWSLRKGRRSPDGCPLLPGFLSWFSSWSFCSGERAQRTNQPGRPPALPRALVLRLLLRQASRRIRTLRGQRDLSSFLMILNCRRNSRTNSRIQYSRAVIQALTGPENCVTSRACCSFTFPVDDSPWAARQTSQAGRAMRLSTRWMSSPFTSASMRSLSDNFGGLRRPLISRLAVGPALILKQWTGEVSQAGKTPGSSRLTTIRHSRLAGATRRLLSCG